MPPLSNKDVAKIMNHWIEECKWTDVDIKKRGCEHCPHQLIYCREARDAIVKALLGREEKDG